MTRTTNNLLLSLFLFVASLPWAVAETGADKSWLGSNVCKGCHAQAVKDWEGSHHDWAMKPATAEFVLGGFDDQEFEHFGQRSRFFKKGAEYWIETDNAEGKQQAFKVAYTFGFHPLQQYLLELDHGKLQALTIAWDSRRKDEGGQRWFHLYPDEKIPSGDPLHWTGAYFNWNSRCAECHSTNLQRNYEPKLKRYDTQWSEINVACEACHGPGAEHVQWAKKGAKVNKEFEHAFIKSLRPQGQWISKAGESTAKRDIGPRKAGEVSEQITVCGSCHSRRRLLEAPAQSAQPANADFSMAHSLQTLQSPLYHRDGQIRDEVYVLGSFLQSKMHEQGVQCSNCHEPHSLKLKGGERGVCAQCHSPAKYDKPEHHHHKVNSEGALCANCHMPETRYMVVDPRRDHSIRIPRPDLSDELATPNACVQCHEDRSNKWASDIFISWFKDMGQPLPPRPALAALGSDELLAQMASAPAVVGATILERLSANPNADSFLLAQTRLHSPEPLLREAAVGFMSVLPPEQRLLELTPLLDEPVNAVRLAIARELLGVDTSTLAAQQKQQFDTLQQQYWQSLQFHGDTAAGQLNIGLYHLAFGQLKLAEHAYQAALELEPQHIGARLNMADLMRRLGRGSEALNLLQETVKAQPKAAAAQHALGLAWVRSKNYPKALLALEQAAQLERQNDRYQYVFAVALNSQGHTARAIKVLELALARPSSDQQIRQFLAQLYRKVGRASKAVELFK